MDFKNTKHKSVGQFASLSNCATIAVSPTLLPGPQV